MSTIAAPTGIKPTPPIPAELAPQIDLSDNARQVLVRRYVRRGPDGKPAESVEEMFWRVAYHVALVEDQWGHDVLGRAGEYYQLLTSKKFFPNSPTFTGAGTPLGQLAACFTAGMRVTTENGIVPIANLRVGERVLTHEGRFRPVTELFTRAYHGELLRLQIKLIGVTLEVTPEHPILTPNGWVKAGELAVGDRVAIGTLRGSRPAIRFDLAESVYAENLEVQTAEDGIRVRRPSTYQNSGRQAAWGKRYIESDAELARLCGYYVSEGTVGPDERYVRFTFSKDEAEYQQDVIALVRSLFEVEASVIESNFGNWVNIDIYSRAIAAWFRQHFGTHSYGKRLPLWLQYAGPDVQQAFLVGVMRGDGLFYEKQHIIKGRKSPKMFRSLRLTLANPGLIQQIWQMCLRLGYDAAIRPVDTSYVTPNASPTAQISMPPLQSRQLVQAAFGRELPEPDTRYVRNSVTRDSEQVYFEIESVEAQEFSGLVYNCEVDEDHSYVTEGVVVHNCFVLPISDDMGRRSSGIFQTLRDAALIQQTGGGNGFAFSRLRPKNSLVKSSAGQATGPVGFLRVYDQAFGEIAQGGCLLPETLVFTEKGLLRLDEIADPQTPGWQSHDLRVATDEGWRNSPRAFNNGVAEVLRVHSGHGLSLAGTPDHRVKVMTDQGPQWRRLQELQRGDWLVVRLGQHQGSLQKLRHPQRQHGNQDWPKLPVVVDEEMAFFLGYLAGGGFVAAATDDHRLGVSVAHNSYLMTEMPAMMERLFGVNVHQQQKAQDRSINLVIDNRAVKEFLQLNGLAKSRSREVSVPRLIRQSSPEIVGAYLRGLFEADGSVNHGYPVLMTTSPRLAEEVSTLLLGLGCPVRVRSQAPGVDHYGKLSIYQVRIESSLGLQAWRERIGCDQRSRFVVCYAWESDQRRESTYVLPNPRYWLEPALDSITLEQVDARSRSLERKFRSQNPPLRRSLLRYLHGDRNLTRSGYDELCREYPEFAAQARSPQDLWFVQVQAVEPLGSALTLDLEVDDNHTYLAYGIVTHNSRRGANMAVLRVDHPDIEDFISCKTDERSITNFNISVGITDAFMRAVENDEMWDLRFPDVASPAYHGFEGTLEQAEAAGIPIKVYKSVRARELFDKIVTQAHHNGEPGVLFLDAANRYNPVPHLYQLESTNPCITGDTLIYTDQGLRRADELAQDETALQVVSDGRFGTQTLLPASTVFATGIKPVYRLTTREGYELRLTGDHRVMTPSGWVEAQALRQGDRLHILNRKGGFGAQGSLEEGRVLGWLVGDGTINAVRAVLSFFGEEKRELAPLFAEAVTGVVEKPGQRRSYPVGVTQVPGRDEARVMSDRLRTWASGHGLTEDKHIVPPAVLAGSEEMQRGFLQALFTADGQVNDGGEKGCSVRLSASHLPLLKNVQRLLLNFGVVSRIYENRRPAGFRPMPDGHGGKKEYFHQAQHDLAVSKTNLHGFANEIGFLSAAKQNRLEAYLQRMQRGPYSETYTVRVEELIAEGEELVYDLHQPDTHAFIANGIVVHNCGEQWLGPNENCCLGSVNLAQHFGPDHTLDWEALRQSVTLSTRFLDDVVDANAYVPAVPQLKEAAHRARRIGLGIMGLGDLMYHVGLRYGSPAGQEFAAQVMEFVRYHAMQTSVQLAEERGPFPAIEDSLYDPDELKWSPPQSIVPYGHDWGRPALDWQSIVHGIKTHGIRNAAQTTIAPTGTIATVAGCEGYGCEPVFALAYLRHVNDNGKDLTLTYASPQFEQALIEAGHDETERRQIIEKTSESGACQHIESLSKDFRNTYVVSSDISAEEHVRMQAAMQAFVDNSLSKTVNFPPGAVVEDVSTAYKLAWKLGCKGITVYVTGSRQVVVLETKETAKKKEEPAVAPALVAQPSEQLVIWHETKKPRPKRLHGFTYTISTPLGKAFITININGGGQPFEAFINTSKAGSDTAAVSEAIGRLISYILRLASPIAPRERLAEVVRQLSGIGGGRSTGFGPSRVRSLPDGVAQALAEYLEESSHTSEQLENHGSHSEPGAGHSSAGSGGNGHHPVSAPRLFGEEARPPAQMKIGDLCPECGEAAVVNEEGCRKCYACGFSEC